MDLIVTPSRLVNIARLRQSSRLLVRIYPKALALFPGLSFKSAELLHSPKGVLRVGKPVSQGDDLAIEENAVIQVHVPKEASVAITIGSAGFARHPDSLSRRSLPNECRRFQGEPFNGFPGVHRFRCFHSNQPDSFAAI
jgi:hypothetical protein